MLGRAEAYNPEARVRFDLLDVSYDERGARLLARVLSNAFWTCPSVLVVFFNADNGTVWTYRHVQPEGFDIFGIKAGSIPCDTEETFRLQGATETSRIRIALYDGALSLAEAVQSEPVAASNAMFLEDAARQAQQDESAPSAIERQLSATLGPVVRWAAILGGTWLLLDNRDLISDSVKGLLDG